MTAPLEKLHDILPGPQLDTFDTSYQIITLIFILFILSSAIIFKIWPRYKIYNNAKRKFRKILKEHPENFISDLNLLFKDIAENFWPPEQYASLHTQAWLAFLDTHSKCQFSQFSTQWEVWSYSHDSISLQDKKAIIRECNHWLRTVCRREPLL